MGDEAYRATGNVRFTLQAMLEDKGATPPEAAADLRLRRMRKLYGLQYLRAMAALGVVAFHAAGRAGSSFHAGESGVDIFFVLSGFLMVAITNEKSRPSDFFIDRLKRIVPLYWIATTILLVGGAAKLFPNLQLDEEHIAASYLFLPWPSPMTGRPWPLLVPGWTLNYEIAFYAAFGLAMDLRSQVRQVAALSALFIALVGLPYLLPMSGAIASTYTDPILLEFMVGCWLGIASKASSWPAWLGWPTATIAGAMLIALGILEPPSHRLFSAGFPAALLVASVLAIEQRRPIPRADVPLLLGNASYSIYLFHGFGISVGNAVAARLGLGIVTTAAFDVAAGTAVGLVAYAFIEKPLLVYFKERRYSNGNPIPAGP